MNIHVCAHTQKHSQWQSHCNSNELQWLPYFKIISVIVSTCQVLLQRLCYPLEMITLVKSLVVLTLSAYLWNHNCFHSLCLKAEVIFLIFLRIFWAFPLIHEGKTLTARKDIPFLRWLCRRMTKKVEQFWSHTTGMH